MVKYLIIFAFAFTLTDLNDIAKINALKKEAEKAYKSGNYDLAAEKYSYLIDTLGIEDDKAMLNLAHSYFHLLDSSNSQFSYQKATTANDKKVRSAAYQQLGVLADKPNSMPLALNYFKEAIKADPANDDARYNYEVLKKKMENQQQNQDNEKNNNKDQKKDDKDQGKKDQQNKDQQEEGQENKEQNQEQKEEKKDPQKQEEEKDGESGEDDQEQKEGEREEKEQDKKGEEEKESQETEDKPEEGEEKKESEMSTSQKLQEMNISPEQAKMILEAMKNQEVQYLQQQRRKPTKPRNRTKPDW